jgi:hypothetical protein
VLSHYEFQLAGLPRENEPMPRERPTATKKPSYVPPISGDELALRNKAAIALLASWAADGDVEEQRETTAILREALGKNRIASSRELLP